MMRTMGIGEIQKNISILSSVSEVIEVLDLRKNKKVATIYPYQKTGVALKLAGKYKDRIAKIKTGNNIREEAMFLAMKEKYGFTD